MTDTNNTEQSSSPEEGPKKLTSTTRFAGISSRPLVDASHSPAPENPIPGFAWFGIGVLVGALFVTSLSWAVVQHRMAEDEFGRGGGQMTQHMPDMWSDGRVETAPESEFFCQEMMGDGSSSGMVGQGAGDMIGGSSSFEVPTPGMMGGAASSVTGMMGGMASGGMDSGADGMMDGRHGTSEMAPGNHPGQIILCANDSMGILFENRDPGIYANNIRLRG